MPIYVKNGLEDTKIVVIDDCASNLKQEFNDSFIQTKGKHVLAPIHVKKAIEVLNK